MSGLYLYSFAVSLMGSEEGPGINACGQSAMSPWLTAEVQEREASTSHSLLTPSHLAPALTTSRKRSLAGSLAAKPTRLLFALTGLDVLIALDTSELTLLPTLS